MPERKEPAAESPEASVARAERLLERGEPVPAQDAAQSGLRDAPGHVRLRQLLALALARSGDVERANALLSALAAEGHHDSETLGMLARTHKDLGLGARDAGERNRHLAAGQRLYAQAFEAARERGVAAEAGYAGINAAAMSVLSGDLARGRALAAEVREICGGAGTAPAAATDYWREATLGEAALILGEYGAARGHYEAAVRLARGRLGDVSSTRRQAALLAAHLPGAPIDATEVLAIPPVLVFTGHMLDAAGRGSPRFPAALEGAVRSALRERIARMAPMAAYGSAACGVDLLCLEAARELGAETHVVLPFPPADFKAASVAFAGGDWEGRFERALAAADSVTVTSDHRATGSAATFDYANLILTGMGCLRAQVLDAPLRTLAAWDAGASGFAGGAASLVEIWQRRGLAVEHVDIAKLRGTPAAAPTRAAVQAAPPSPHEHALRAMLFADVVGYSHFHEDQIPPFVDEFLGSVAALNRESPHRAEHVETAGDGLYFVFANTEDAAHYALALSALVRARDWSAAGLPAQFDLRIALHCGPVHRSQDPVTGRPLYTGPHTSRAARIEPITPPGLVYASQAFAAVAAAQGVSGIDLRYVGTVALAKGYGSLPLYHVCPPAERNLSAKPGLQADALS